MASSFLKNDTYEQALTLETADPEAFKRLSSAFRMGLSLYRDQRAAVESVRLKELAAEFKPDATFDELLDDLDAKEREEILSRYPGTRSLLATYAERRSAVRTLAARKN